MGQLARSAVAVATAVFASATPAAPPQRTFVASTGNDANPCSLVAPCRGFQAAIDAVAAGGEVVALDSAGYGAMQIHKSLSIIVPPGIHAGLSPSTGIPIPGFPGQTTVVLIDIQNADTVTLRGLDINHQGSVTGGIDWVSANGGTLNLENVVVGGFPNEGLLASAPGGTLLVKDSLLRGNGYGVYVRNYVLPLMRFSLDRVRVENSNWGITNEGASIGMVHDSTISYNAIGLYHYNPGYPSQPFSPMFVSRSMMFRNELPIKLVSTANGAVELSVGATTISHRSASDVLQKSGPSSTLISEGNNATDKHGFWDVVIPPE